MKYTPIQHIDLAEALENWSSKLREAPYVRVNSDELVLDGNFTIEQLKELVKIHDEIVK